MEATSQLGPCRADGLLDKAPKAGEALLGPKFLHVLWVVGRRSASWPSWFSAQVTKADGHRGFIHEAA